MYIGTVSSVVFYIKFKHGFKVHNELINDKQILTCTETILFSGFPNIYIYIYVYIEEKNYEVKVYNKFI